ncbi:MAG: hypothetical protein J1G06_05025 [Oscillospiraceae bacterium]|nr:hypothetical protein [Oscillospiraceae bacterium]
MAMSQRMWRREQERRRRERERRARQRRNCMIIVILAIVAVILIISKGCFGKKDSGASKATQQKTNTAGQEAQTVNEVQYESLVDITDIKMSFFSNSAFLGNSVADSIGMYNLLEDADFYTDITLDVDNVYTTATGYSTTAAIDQLKSKQFTRIFLSFGESEIADGDVKEFIKSYKKLIDKVKSYQAKAQIYVISIPPSTRETTSSSLYSMTLGKIKEYNKRIKAMAAEKEVYYVDSVSALGKDGGYLPRGVSADGINLNRGCCIDLLQYITKKAYVPDANSLSEEEADDDTDESEDGAEKTAAPKTSSMVENEPEPTVNVLKDSVKKSGGE